MKINKKFKKISLIVVACLIVIMGTFLTNNADAKSCVQKANELRNKAKSVYAKDFAKLASMNPKTVEAVNLRKNLQNKVNAYVSKKLPKDCR